MVTRDRVTECLNYDPASGIFTWKIARGKSKVDKIAGCVDCFGYIVIRIDGMNYKAHRLAWLYVYGDWPSDSIDHINGIKTDNRLINIRDVTGRENSLNKKVHREGKLPYVSKTKNNKWRAYFYLDNKQKWVGVYDDQEIAYKAVRLAMELQGIQTIIIESKQ